MYILNKCAMIKGCLEQQQQEMCTTHLSLIAIGILYISVPFKLKKLKSATKYSQLLIYKKDYAEELGNITPKRIIDKDGKSFFFDMEGECFLENFLMHKKTKELTLKSRYKTTQAINGVRLLSSAIHFHDSLLNTSQSQFTKISYYYCRGVFKYIITRDGIFDTDNKKLFDFSSFFVNNSIPKRLIQN